MKHKKRDYPICLKKERIEFLRANPQESKVVVPSGALRAEHVLGTIPDSLGTNPIASGNTESEKKGRKRGSSLLLKVKNPFKKRSKSPNAPKKSRGRPMLQRRASVSDMFKKKGESKGSLSGYLTRGFGTAHGIGYVPGLVDSESVKKNLGTITLYLNTVATDKGKTVDVDFHQIHRLGGTSNKERFDYFMDWCRKQAAAATKIKLILRVPDHLKVRSFRGIRDGERYLLVGQEFLLGYPEHYNRDYPAVLKEERKAYISANPMKSVIKKPLLQQFVHNLTASPKIVNIKIFINGMKGHKDPYELRFDTRKYSKHAEGAEAGYDQMKKETFEKMQSSGLILHTPIVRFFEVPSHVEVKRVAEFSDEKTYLAVGREHLLYTKTNGCPDHDQLDYPSVLVGLRVQYLLSKKMAPDDRVGRIESPGGDYDTNNGSREEILKELFVKFTPVEDGEEEVDEEEEEKKKVLEESIEEEKEEMDKKEVENEEKKEEQEKEKENNEKEQNQENENEGESPQTPSSLLELDIRRLEEEMRKLEMDIKAERERD